MDVCNYLPPKIALKIFGSVFNDSLSILALRLVPPGLLKKNQLIDTHKKFSYFQLSCTHILIEYKKNVYIFNLVIRDVKKCWKYFIIIILKD
jgi:hypothetical protein